MVFNSCYFFKNSLTYLENSYIFEEDYDGDGTVSVNSLRGCLTWEKDNMKIVDHKVIQKIDHLKILQDTNLFDYIKTVLMK